MAKVDGRPVVFAYDSYHIKPAEWAQILGKRGSLRGTELDIFVIGLWLEAHHGDELARAGFDGAYTYFGNEVTGFGGALRNWQAMAAEAQRRSLAFVPCVSPGYDDEGIRPWNARATVQRGKNGATYRRTWEAALSALKRGGGIARGGVGITSYNEWGEGTQIEPASTGRLRPAARGQPPRLYDDYGDDPYIFLNITLEYARKFRRIVHSDKLHDEM